MNEINEINKMVLTDVPKVLENEQIYVYIPIAVGDKPGIIAVPADSKDFEVVNGNLKLKWDIDELLATKLNVPDRGKSSTVLTVNDQGIVRYVPYSASRIIENYSIPMRTADGDLLVLDEPKDEHAAVNQKYVDKRDNELDTAIQTKANEIDDPYTLYGTDVSGKQIGIRYSSTVSYGRIPIADADGNFQVDSPKLGKHVANKEYADRIFNEGGTIQKDLNVLGDLKVQGNLIYVTGTTEGVEKQFVELNVNKKLVIGQSGLLINKGVTANGDLGTYAIVYDADKDAVVCGLGTTSVEEVDGKKALVFKFNNGEGLPLAIRDESNKMTDGNLIIWDAITNKLKTAYQKPNDFLRLYSVGNDAKTLFVMITQDEDGNPTQELMLGEYSVGQPGTSYDPGTSARFLPVLRGLDGSLKARPVAGNKSNFDVIVREELTAALNQLKSVIISDETFIVDLDNTTPSGATSGTLTEEQFNTLNNNHNVCIKFNNEYYYLADKGHTEGILSYTHQGWNGDAMQDKSINITTNTLAWTLVIGTPNKVIYRHTLKITKDSADYAGTVYCEFYSSNALEIDSLTDLKTVLGDNYCQTCSGYLKEVNGSILRNALYLYDSQIVVAYTYAFPENPIPMTNCTFTDSVTPI